MKPCPNCLRIVEHDYVPGNRTFPAYRYCSFCGWATPAEIQEDQ